MRVGLSLSEFIYINYEEFDLQQIVNDLQRKIKFPLEVFLINLTVNSKVSEFVHTFPNQLSVYTHDYLTSSGKEEYRFYIRFDDGCYSSSTFFSVIPHVKKIRWVDRYYLDIILHKVLLQRGCTIDMTCGKVEGNWITDEELRYLTKPYYWADYGWNNPRIPKYYSLLHKKVDVSLHPTRWEALQLY